MVIFAVHPAEPQGTTTVSSPTASRPRAIVIIPARYRSSRLPGKPLADIAGRPMVEHVYRHALAAARAASVLVATDDDRVSTAVRAFGGNVRLTSPDHQNGTERLAEVACDLTAEFIVNLQADEPLVKPSMIDLVLGALESHPDVSMATLRTPLTVERDVCDPHVVKVVVDQHNFALYFSRAAVPYTHHAADPASTGPIYKHIGLYAYRREFLLRLATLTPMPLEQAERLEQLRALEHGYRIKTEKTPYDPVGVDTLDDLERVRQIIGDGVSR